MIATDVSRYTPPRQWLRYDGAAIPPHPRYPP